MLHSNRFRDRTDLTPLLLYRQLNRLYIIMTHHNPSTRNLRIFVVAAVVITYISINIVVAYRPSTYTNAPTSLSYDGGVTKISTSAASDAAVANYMRKRYGSSSTTMDGGIPLNTIYSPPSNTATTNSAGVITTEGALQLQRNKWGVDNQYANEYWFDKRIHTLGNHGFLGALHAALAPISTKLIDMAAYDGIDIRKEVRCLCIQFVYCEYCISHCRRINPIVNTPHEAIERTIQNDCWF